VDGTLVEAWASQKSFKPKPAAEGVCPHPQERGVPSPAPPPAVDDPGNPTVHFRGERRTNQTHESTTDPEARLYKKASGQEAQLCYQGHVLMENRNGLVVDAQVTEATGTAEREAALEMIQAPAASHRVTLGGDKGYDTQDFVQDVREAGVTPHVAQHTTGRASAIDRRTTRHPGYSLSQARRKRVEEIFGWLKTVGLMRKTRHRGRDRVGWMFTFTAAVYNLVRIRNVGLAGG
jgi:hypothetical protein